MMMLRRLVLIALCVVAAVSPLRAQAPAETTGTISAAGADCSTATRCVVLPIGQANGTGLITVGTFTGTIAVEVSPDNATWTSPAGGTTSITTAGNYFTSLQGARWLRVRASSLGSGTPAVVLSATSAPFYGSVTVTGTAAVSGTVTANAGTNLNTSALALETGGNLAAIKTDADKIPSQGQALAAASMPVVLPATQITTLTPPTTVTVTQGTASSLKVDLSGTAANATAIKVDGSAVTQPVSLTGNQAVNVAQFNGVTPLMGNGVAGTGAQRVTIASDNTAFTVNAAESGTWTVQPGNTANTTPWLTTISQGGNAAAVNASGQLSITCANCSGSGASAVDESAFTQGTNSVAPSGLLFKTSYTALTSGQVGVLRGFSDGSAYVMGSTASGAADAGNPIKIGSVFNTTQPTVTTGQRVDNQATARGAQIVATGVDTFNATINTALPAGSNVIGHVIADSGSTTAVTGNVTVTQGTGTNLHIVCDSGCSSSAGFADNSAFTFGTTAINPIGGVLDDTSTNVATENSAAVARITPQKALHINLRNQAGTEIGTSSTPVQVSLANTAANATAVKVDGSAVVQPVSGTVTTSPPSNASTNVAQLAGTTTSVNSGVKDAGTLRVVLATDQPQLTNKLLVTPDSVALPANQSVNVSQVNGVTTLTGTGAVGTGTQRVAVGTDTATIAGSAPGAAGSASANVVTVQGIASMTKLLVTPDSVALPANQSVNLSQVGGSTMALGQQLAAASLPVVLTASQLTTLTPPTTVTANQGTANGTPWNENVAQFGGSAVVTGTGTGGAGIPRVTVSSDSTVTANAGTNLNTSALALDATAVAGNTTLSAIENDLRGVNAGQDTTLLAILRAILQQGTPKTAAGVKGSFGRLVTSTQDALDVNVKFPIAQADPCAGLKSSVAISQTANTRLLAGTAARVYLCSVLVVGADAENISFVEGTGATCGTGTAAVIGGTTAANGPNLAANGGFTLGSGSGAIAITATPGTDLCLFQSGAGRVAGNITYAIR